jgi:hypothetical protein
VRFPRPLGAALAVVLPALVFGVVTLGPAAQAASPAAAPSFVPSSLDEPPGTALQRDLLAQSTQSWHGGPITASTGDTVTVYVSDTYTPDEVTPEYWAEFLAHLTHGPELANLKVYIAPIDEVSNLCGPQALGCYGDDELVAIGEPYIDGTTPEEVVRHEYGHHVAFNRANPPWSSVDWGPKRWASSENVCAKVGQQLAYPGDEGDHYALNPGEAWAETYRLMDEKRAGITTGSWQIVAPSFYPTDTQLQAATDDVLTPWAAPPARTYRKVFATKTKTVWTIPLTTPLDGTFGASVVVPKGSVDQVVLTTANGRTVLARATRTGVRTMKLSSTVCGQRSLSVRVTRKGASGAVSVTTSTP